MEESSQKKFSYPNSDQEIGGVSDPSRIIEPEVESPKTVVHILDALSGAKKDNDTRTIRTYQEDITDAIKNDNVSMIKMSLAEKKRQERQGTFDQVTEEKANTTRYIAIGVFVIFLILIGLGAAYYFSVTSKAGISQEAPPVQALVYTESSMAIDTDSRYADDISRLVMKERDAKLDLGNMKEIILTTGSGTSTRRITAQEFFKLMETSAPDGLTRSMNPVFAIGAYSYSPHDLFGLFKINTYDSAFAGMLQWEPYMERDIGDMFITKTAAVLPTAGTSSTSTASSFKSRVFVDRVIDNKDVRVLLNEDGTVALLYSFLDKETLVISSSEKALKELSFRLTAGRIAR